jgi:hypothetical protein
MTAQGPRKGEPSGMFYAAGFRTPPARLVRGSSRRIMTMRLRPANIRVINRRDSSWAVLGPAVPNRCSTLTSRNVFPPPPPVEVSVDARTVLALKGSLRRARNGRALDRCAPFRRDRYCDGRLRREQFSMFCTKTKNSRCSQGLTESLHIRTGISKRIA